MKLTIEPIKKPKSVIPKTKVDKEAVLISSVVALSPVKCLASPFLIKIDIKKFITIMIPM